MQQERDLEDVGNDLLRYNEIKTALFASQQELDSLERSIKLRDPLYYQGFIDNSFTTLQDTRNGLLKDRSGLLEIFYGDSAVYSLLVAADHDSLRRIDKTVYDQAVQEYLSFLADPALLNRRFPDYLPGRPTGLYLLFCGPSPAAGPADRIARRPQLSV